MAVTSTINLSNIGDMTYVGPIQSLSDPEELSRLDTLINESIDDGHNHIVLDLGELETLGSLGLEFLTKSEKTAKKGGGWLKATNIGKDIQDVFIATRLDKSIASIDNNVTSARPTNNFDQPNKKIGDILIEKGFVNEEQMEEAWKLQKQLGLRIGNILVDNGWINEEQLLIALSDQINIPYLKLRQGLYDTETTTIVDKDVLLRLEVLPMFQFNNKIIIATNNPQSVTSLDELQLLTGCKIIPVLSCRNDILDSINNVFGGSSFIADYIDDIKKEFDASATQLLGESIPTESAYESSPVINLVNTIIQQAVNELASDIHIEPSQTKTSIRFRIDGILHEVMAPPLNMHPAIVSRFKVMAQLDIAEKRLPQDGRIQVTVLNRQVDLRFSSLPGIFGEVIVLRVLDKQQTVHDIHKLGLTSHNKEKLLKLLSLSNGLTLVTGPTGSGKTTTLYAALHHLNSMEKNTVTIEDPVEYQVEIINQNQVNETIGLSFAKILKHVLRQDPDIIMVGEIRDMETAEITIHSALTGHLVLSTLHTNDAVSAINRLTDMGVEAFLLSSSLSGIISQRLVRKICSACKVTSPAPEDFVKQYVKNPDKTLLESPSISHGAGCPKCLNSGFKGRLGIYEIVVIDEGLQKLITQKVPHDELVSYLKSQNHASMFDDGIKQVLLGNTTIEEVTRVTNIS